MECCLEVDGGNNYKLPHMQKAKKMKEGRLPESFECKRDLFDRVQAEP